jgi:predicted HD phosphohydrolase
VTFTRMDESTAAQWQQIMVETIEHQPRVADRVLAMLASLEEITDGFAVDQLDPLAADGHPGRGGGATTEVVVASLCHDIGKAVSVMNHPRSPPRSCGPTCRRRHLPHDPGPPGLPGPALLRVPRAGPRTPGTSTRAAWYALAEQFADEWDQISFDPDYPTKPLSHFEPMVREVFGHTRTF